MKKILLFLSVFLALALFQDNAFAADSVIHESCQTWSYASQYPNNCDVCWYYTKELYKGQSKDYWDYFMNDAKKEQIISSSSNWTITPLNWSTLSSSWNIQLRANWVPATAGINGTKEVVIFYLENLLFSSNWTWSVIWRLEFNLKWAAVDRTNQADSTSISMPSLGWNWMKWIETLKTDGEYLLSGSYINGPTGALDIYSGSIYNHKECYILRWAWCWDGAVNWTESCDHWALNWTAWDSCSATCTTVTIPWGGWGGWGGWWGGWGAWSCWNWTVDSGEECDLGSGNNNKWSCSTSCKWTYCWDWNLQRPNSTAKWAIFEECDFGTSVWPSWCSRSNCKIVWDITTPTESCVSNCDNTTPSDKDWIIFYPSGWALLWNGMKLWDTYSLAKPYIKNNTGYDIYIPKQLCLYKENKSSLQWNNSICSSSQIWELYSGQKFDFNIADYVANISYLPAGYSYQDVNITTAPQGLQNSYLSSVLTVRVAKPTVANVYGWTSLLNFNPILYSDVEALSQNFLNDLRNKNFVVASIADTTGKSFSSYVSSVWDKTVYDNSVNNWNSSAATSIAKLSSTWYATPINTLPTEKYNWLQNVFIHKWDVSLEWQAISGNKTFIVENWNLIINWSISSVSGSNIAFIVKWGNIIIGSDVSKIDWVYLAIKQDNIWGKINSDAIKTNNRLMVNGWLYWDARDLIANRTYMKSDNWIINVWTTINFRSGVFTNPPPLLTTFIDEYMKVNKIAK